MNKNNFCIVLSAAISQIQSTIAQSASMIDAMIPFNHVGLDEYSSGQIRYVHEYDQESPLQSTFLSGHSSRRNMQALFYATTSAECKQCIDDNYYFCQNAAGSAGQCCEDNDCNEVDVCSYHAPQQSRTMKYWACPHALDICGVENLYVPSKSGAAGTLRPKGKNRENFTDASMCRYRIVFPQPAGEFDLINFQLQTANNVEVYMVETSTYKSQNFRETQLVMGQQVKAEWPNEIFVLVLVNTNGGGGLLFGDFAISYQYEDKDPAEVLKGMTQEERDLYNNLLRITEEESVAETGTFWYFVVGGVVGVILIITLICCLVRMKKKNDLIVAKVITLEELQAGANNDNTPDEQKNDDFYNSRRASMKKQSAPASVPSQTPFNQEEQNAVHRVDQEEQDQTQLTMIKADHGRLVNNSVNTLVKQQSVIKRESTQEISAPQPDQNPDMTSAEKIEAEKIAKMKELLRRGDATVPKRRESHSFQMQAPGVSAVKVQASGYVDYDMPATRSISFNAPPPVVDDSSPTKSKTSSVPAPVQSRVIFSGATGLGLGGIGQSTGMLPDINQR